MRRYSSRNNEFLSTRYTNLKPFLPSLPPPPVDTEGNPVLGGWVSAQYGGSPYTEYFYNQARSDGIGRGPVPWGALMKSPSKLR